MRPLHMTVAALAVAVGACATPPKVVDRPSATGVTTSTVPAVSTPLTTAAAHVGATLTVSGNNGEQVDITLLKVIDPAAGADSFSTPEAGKRFVAIQIKETNSGAAALDDDPNNDATLWDGGSQQFTPDFNEVAGCPTTGSQVKLAAGDSVVGCITFQVPAASVPARFQYTLNSGFANNTAKWLLP